MQGFHQLLAAARARGASDVHLKEGMAPALRTSGGLAVLDGQPWERQHLEAVMDQMLGAKRFREFLETGEADLAIHSPESGRARVACYVERGQLGMAVRLISLHVPELSELGLPEQISRLASYPDGLVIVAGPTGSGKSTTLAGVINQINASQARHILTIEDPIEYVHPRRSSIITQREVGQDTQGFHAALRSAMRQDPDVIVIGEARDAETMRTALAAAETGHLVFTTLHTVSAAETLARIFEMFPVDQHAQLRGMLAGVLRAVVCQRILPDAHGGRAVVQEIMFQSGRVSDAIADPDKAGGLEDIIAESASHHQMQTFNQALCAMVASGRLAAETAVQASSRPQDLRLLLQRSMGHDPLAPGGGAPADVGLS